MANSLRPDAADRHSVLPDIGHPVMAKAAVQDPDVDWMIAIGAAIQVAVRDARWSNKEAAAKACVDDAEFGKWVNGTRRPQFDKLFAVPELRQPLVIAIALLIGDGVEVETVVRVIRRRKVA